MTYGNVFKDDGREVMDSMILSQYLELLEALEPLKLRSGARVLLYSTT